MNTLHILTKNLVPDLVHSRAQDDAVLLIQDAVYLLLTNSFTNASNIYAIADDINARMPTARISQNITVISYAEFVELCCNYQRSITW